MDPSAIIEAHDLSLRYGASPAFRGVELSIAQGSVTAFVGPSGCGKTSVLQCMTRLTDLVPHCHVTGKLRVAGVDVLSRRCDVSSLRRRVGTIFQKPTPFPISIRRNIALPLREHGCARGDIEETVERALREVGLWHEVCDRLDTPAVRLSGGQQQRLCIARSLALRPEVLLMDEPCSALDPMATARIEELLDALRGDYTVVVVTHNIAQARRVSDDTVVFWVDDDGVGMVVEAGPSERLFAQPEHPVTQAYLGGERG